jgi:NADH-quinone oxidoreductase subunit E
VDLHDTVKRIDGTEVPLTTPWLGVAAKPAKLMAQVEEKAPANATSAKATPAKAASEKTAKPVAKPSAPAKMAEAPAAAATGSKPKALKAARGGKADDLKVILGIGPKLEALCHRLGFFHFDQIAAWTEAEIAWVDDNLEGFKGRVTRDKWVVQAKILAAGGSVAEAEAAAKA